MKVKMLKAWGFSKIGEVIDPPIGVAIELVKIGRAEFVGEVELEDDRQAIKLWNKRVSKPPRAKKAQA